MIAEATAALLEGLVAFFPEPRRRLLRNSGGETADRSDEGDGTGADEAGQPGPGGRDARQRWRSDLAGADIERLIDRLAGIVGVDPGPLTLRQLVRMAEARREHDWNIASSVMAMLAEIHRDRKATPQAVPAR